MAVIDLHLAGPPPGQFVTVVVIPIMKRNRDTLCANFFVTQSILRIVKQNWCAAVPWGHQRARHHAICGVPTHVSIFSPVTTGEMLAGLSFALYVRHLPDHGTKVSVSQNQSMWRLRCTAEWSTIHCSCSIGWNRSRSNRRSWADLRMWWNHWSLGLCQGGLWTPYKRDLPPRITRRIGRGRSDRLGNPWPSWRFGSSSCRRPDEFPLGNYGYWSCPRCRKCHFLPNESAVVQIHKFHAGDRHWLGVAGRSPFLLALKVKEKK